MFRPSAIQNVGFSTLAFVLWCVVTTKGQAAFPAADSVIWRPEFYKTTPRKVADSTFVLKCYDRQNKETSCNASWDNVRFVSVFREYTDYKHTFKDKDGVVKPLPASQIVMRYDKTGTDHWMAVNYATGAYTNLKEYRDKVTQKDTALVEGRRQLYYYIKVE